MWDARKFDNSELMKPYFRKTPPVSFWALKAVRWVIKIPGTFVCAKHECTSLDAQTLLQTSGLRRLWKLEGETRLFLTSTYLVVMVDGFVDPSSVSLNVIFFLTSCTFFLEFFFQIFSSCSYHVVTVRWLSWKHCASCKHQRFSSLSLDQIDNIFDHTFNVVIEYTIEFGCRRCTFSDTCTTCVISSLSTYTILSVVITRLNVCAFNMYKSLLDVYPFLNTNANISGTLCFVLFEQLYELTLRVRI
jgi:hypothetical protein